MRIFMTIFYLLMIALGVSFSVLNADFVKLNLYYQTLDLPMSVLLISTFSMGIMFGLFTLLFRHLRLKMAFSRLKSQLTMTEREVKNLRSIPIQDQH